MNLLNVTSLTLISIAAIAVLFISFYKLMKDVSERSKERNRQFHNLIIAGILDKYKKIPRVIREGNTLSFYFGDVATIVIDGVDYIPSVNFHKTRFCKEYELFMTEHDFEMVALNIYNKYKEGSLSRFL